MQTVRRWVLLIGVFFPLAFALVPQDTHAARPVVFMLDWFPNPNHVPIYVALNKGFFQRAGLQVKLQIPADPNDPLKLVAAGKVDFAVNYQPSVTIATSQGLPVLAVGVLVEHPLTTIMFLKDSGIQTPRDLRGKKIGFSVAGFEEAIFSTIAGRGGLKRGDYTFVNVNFNLVPALLSRQVDAVVGAYRNFEKIQLELQGKAVGIFPPEQFGVPDFYELVLITNTRTAQTQPELVRAFAKGIAGAIRYTLSQPDDAGKIFFAANPKLRDELNRRAYKATLPVYARSQVQSRDKWANFQDFMARNGVITSTKPVDQLFSNQFAPPP